MPSSSPISLPAGQPPVFGSMDDLLDYFRRYSGAKAPYIRGVKLDDEAVGAFLRRTFDVLCHPDCSSRQLFFAQARQLAVQLHASVCAATVAEMIAIHEKFPGACNKEVDIVRYETLHRQYQQPGVQPVFLASDPRLLDKVATQLAKRSRALRGDRGHAVHEASRQVDALRELMFAIFGVNAAVNDEKRAQTIKGSRARHDGDHMEAHALRDGLPHIALALRAAASTTDVSHTIEDLRDGGVVDASDAVAMPRCPRFVMIRNVDVWFDGVCSGELDGVVVDCERQEVALVCEVKHNAADLCAARTQRQRFTSTLQTAYNRRQGRGLDDPVAAARRRRARPDIDSAAPLSAEIRLNVKGAHADAFDRLRRNGAVPALCAETFEPVRQQPVRRWLFMTCGGERPQHIPMASNVNFMVVRDLASALAVEGWVPPSLDAVDAHPSLIRSAYDTAVTAFESLTIKQIRHAATAAVGSQWKIVTKGDEEYMYGYARLEDELRETALVGDDGTVTPTIIAFVDVNLPPFS